MTFRVGNAIEASAWMALWQEAFPEDPPAWIGWYARTYTRPGSVWAAWDGADLVSMVHCNRSVLHLAGRVLPACAIAGVATALTHRKQGLARMLMAQSQQSLREQGVALAYLYPFSYAFYEAFGWTAAYSASACHLAGTEALPVHGTLQWADCPRAADFSAMAGMYGVWTQGLDGYRLRSDGDMAHLWEDAAMDGGRLAFWRHGGVQGYGLLVPREGSWYVQDWCCPDEGGMMAALQQALQCPLSWLSPDGEERIPRDMVRILAFAPCLEGAACAGSAALVLAVEDAFMQENTGTYYVFAEEGRLHCQPSNAKPQVWGSIQAWTQLLLGYASPKEAGIVYAEEDRGLEASLKALFPRRRTWLQEMYV